MKMKLIELRWAGRKASRSEIDAAKTRWVLPFGDIPHTGRSSVEPLLESSCAEGALWMQCRRLRGLGRVRRRAQLPLLELPRDDRLGIPALGRDRAREV